MLTVATEYFGLMQDSRLKVVIDDGVKFLKKAVKNGIAFFLFFDSTDRTNFNSFQGQSFKAVLFDVDGKDSTVGMSCPPVQFLELEVLDTVKSCIRDNGRKSFLQQRYVYIHSVLILTQS